MPRSANPRRTKRLTFEALEDRRLLAVDLRLTSVLLVENDDGTTPTTPVLGERVCVRANFQTTDLPAGASYRLEFKMDGVVINQTLTQGAGLSGTRSWNRFQCGWYATPGSHTVESVTLDADNSVAEANETNNALAPDITFVAAPQTTLPQKLLFPMGGVQQYDWSITNYYDMDPTGGIKDFRQGGYSYDGHTGFDIVLPNFARMDMGVPVYAAADGLVGNVQDGNFDRNTEWLGRPGNSLVIDHGGGWITRYNHFAANTIAIRNGETVQAGQFLGLVGSSGESTAAHLHFDVRRNGAPVETNFDAANFFVNPMAYQADRPSTIKEIRITNVAPTDSEIDEGVPEHSVFSTLNPKNAVVWFRDSHFKPGDQFQVKWYQPDGALNASQNTSINSQHRHGWYYRSLGSSTINARPGTWRVAIEMGGQTLASKTFEVTTGPGIAGIKLQAADGTVIIDNRTTPIDFGSVAVGAMSPTQDISIVNHGTSPLTLSDLRLPPGFALVSEFPSSIAPAASAALTIALDTAKPGAVFGAVQFATNDPDSPIFNFHISGTVTGSPAAGSPAISLPAPATVFRGRGTPVVIDATATVTDSDTTNWSGGHLKVEFATLGSPHDWLALRSTAGSVTVSETSISFNGAVIGTFSGGENGTPLVVAFNALASLAAVEAVLRNVTFGTTATDADSLARYVRFSLTDETGKTSNLPIAVVVQDLKPTTAWIDESGNLVLADTSAAGKSDHWRARVLGADLLLSDATENAIDASSIPGSTGNGTSAVRIPLSSYSATGQWVLDARQGTDRLELAIQLGNPLPAGGVATVSGNPAVGVSTPNQQPTLDFVSDITDLVEDAGQQSIDLTGISSGPGEMQMLAISATSDNPELVADVAVEHLPFEGTGKLRFTPRANQFGSASIVVTIKDNGGTLSGGFEALSRTVAVNVAPVNDPPSFVAGLDQQATDEDGPRQVGEWATSIVAGPANEQTQELSFEVDIDQAALFLELPHVDDQGNLSFTPAPNAHGQATVTVRLKDDGGTGSGGVDFSSQSFAIKIEKLHPWHNALYGLDVTGPGDVADSRVVAGDALAIINYINAFGAGPIPENAAPGPPYLDTVGGPDGSGDDQVVAGDVLAVINFINAFGANLSGPDGESLGHQPDLAVTATAKPHLAPDLLALLALDAALHNPVRRRMR